MDYYIYKYEKDKNIYYIGQSINLKNRIKQHQKEAKFQSYLTSDIFYFKCNSKLEMDSYEYFLINKYHPILNEAYNYQNKNFNITEPEWILYDVNTFEKEKQTKQCNLPINLSLLKEKSNLNNFTSNIYNQITLFEQKMLINMILKYRINNIDFHKNISFSISEYIQEMGYCSKSGKMYTQIQQSYFINKIDRGQYIFCFPKDIINNSFLFIYPLQIINLFRQITNKYTIPLFELITHNQNKEINRDQLIDFLAPTKKSYKNNFKDFCKNVIDKALNDINLILQCNYKYKLFYTGRKVTSLIFYLNEEISNNKVI